jgi:diadenosine tetraphosphate (Ap4A) HIT family hydrolase
LVYPVSPGHTLIISNKEKVDYFQLDQNERQELTKLIVTFKELVEKEVSPDGYNIGMNCGEAAGQTVMHFHCHVIPIYCVSGKGYY